MIMAKFYSYHQKIAAETLQDISRLHFSTIYCKIEKKISQP